MIHARWSDYDRFTDEWKKLKSLRHVGSAKAELILNRKHRIEKKLRTSNLTFREILFTGRKFVFDNFIFIAHDLWVVSQSIGLKDF